MNAYYNEYDPYPAEWTRRLIAAGHIAPGVVDGRPIQEVSREDVRGATQAHFFAGYGTWSYALRLAGVGDDVECWTGSCPCFVAGTLVLTLRGHIPIEEVVIGDRVLTHAGR